MHHTNARMADSVKHISLHGSIVYHIFEDYLVAYLQRFVEFPCRHEVARKAGIATKSVNILALVCVESHLRTSYGWVVRHFQTVRHMTGETYIQNSCLYTFVFHDIYHLRKQITRLPSEGTSRFHYYLQLRIAVM